MKESKRKGIEWIKEHKTELILSGISIGAIIVLILQMKNRTMIEEKIKELKEIIKNMRETPKLIGEMEGTEEICKSVFKENVVRAPHDVKMHPRNLPVGYKPSAKKIEAAARYKYELLPGQTFVEAYRTGGKVA